MPETPVAIFGAGGYTGMILTRLLLRHPSVRPVLLASERLSREGGLAWLAPGEDLSGISITGEAEGAAACARAGAELALLCTPAEMSLDLVPRLLDLGLRVIDLSGAFRLGDAGEFERAYRMPHGARQALEGAVYALPEVTGTHTLPSARLVANPGCYATAALLALAPLCRHRLLRPGAPVFVDGKSGASGAGRKAAIELSLCELEGELRPYRVADHQHEPEMRHPLEGLCGEALHLRFVPHIVGTRRGLLVTCHGQLAEGADGAVRACFLHDYAGERRVHLVPPAEVTLRRPVGTPDAFVGVHAGPDGTFCALASLDNLMKGAASQAVQNLNAMLGLDPGAGLDGAYGV